MEFGNLLLRNIVYRLLNIFTSVCITILFTRLMGVSGYGILALLIANVSIFSLVSCLGSESGIIFHYASGSLGRNKIFSIIYIVILFQLLLFLLSELIYH